MGCIVNGPGEMADADFGYVGSGKISLYVGVEYTSRLCQIADPFTTLNGRSGVT